eukprot:613653-Pleurochrysis_carterae.AAC.1
MAPPESGCAQVLCACERARRVCVRAQERAPVRGHAWQVWVRAPALLDRHRTLRRQVRRGQISACGSTLRLFRRRPTSVTLPPENKQV